MRKDINLTEQLLIICIIILGIIVISLGVILPNNLIPIYETNVYNYLKQPLNFVKDESSFKDNIINTEIAYIYINDLTKTSISVTDNINEVIDIDKIDKLLEKFDLTTTEGKFKYKRRNDR